MGHMIQCFIGNPAIIEEITSPLKPIHLVTVDLPQGLQCLFLCDNLFNSIHQYKGMVKNNCITPFDFLNQEVKNYLEYIKPNGEFIYIETDYFGGEGSQSSGFFINGRLLEIYTENNSDIDVTRPYPDRLLTSPINTTLRRLGVIREMLYDEFDTLGLEKYRHMPNNEI